MLGYRLVYRYRVFVCARARIVLFIMEKIRSTGAFVPGRHTANWQIRNSFLCGISLLLKCAHISTHRSSGGYNQHSTVRPSMLRNADCVCTHTLLKSYARCFILSISFLVHDRAIIRPCWLCNRGQIRCPAVAAIILSRTSLRVRINCVVGNKVLAYVYWDPRRRGTSTFRLAGAGHLQPKPTSSFA